VFSVKYHVIWCPKDRRCVLVGPVERRLKEIIADLVAEFGGVVIEVQTMRDHVHLVVAMPPRVAPSRLVPILKGRSSCLLGREFPHLAGMGWLWSPSWFICTVGGVPLGVVRRYVEDQKVAAARKRAG
jgi:REP-associated tyrosine transposase